MQGSLPARCFGYAHQLRPANGADAERTRDAILRSSLRDQRDDQRRVNPLGWLPDVPDFRDWTRQQLVRELEQRTSTQSPARGSARDGLSSVDGDAGSSGLPSAIDLRGSGWLPPVSRQGRLGSCTAHAVTTMVEALNNRLGRKPLELSRLFLYKVTRNLHGWDGDSGAHLRTTIKALRLFGVPPESSWPYEIDSFDTEPDAFNYAFASNYKATMFARLDQGDRRESGTAETTLGEIKRVVSTGDTAVLGFSVYSNLDRARHRGEIPLPRPADRLRGGHAVTVVGYDDHIEFDESHRGALVFQNSWGRDWGDEGYGYLPYEFVRRGIASDVWTVTNAEWVSESGFGS
ncbi:MAG: C1 family peptidase [Planctomycetota bacterium]